MPRFAQVKNVWFSPAVVLGLGMVVFSCGRTDAHALGADCRIRDGRVLLEAYFSDDTPARHAKVEVKDVAGNVVAEGKTDDEGRWSFALPSAGTYQVAVDAGMGHRTTIALAISEEQLAAGRQEFTHIPWLRVGLGLAVIAALAVMLHVWFRRSQAATMAPHGEAPP
jgi:nickel transport protein